MAGLMVRRQAIVPVSLLLTLLLTGTIAQTENRQHWSSFNFPNPQVDYELCGLSSPGFVCDPGSILLPSEREYLSGIIARIHEAQGCDCGDCNATSVPTAGILPAVAIVPEITGSTFASDDEQMAKTQDFGRSLREEHWQFGAGCDNDFVITLAVKERKIWTTVGVKAQIDGNMMPDCVTDVFNANKGYFSNADYGDGLQGMMDDFRKYIYGYKICEEKTKLSTGAIWGIVAGAFGGLVGLIVLCCCCGCCKNCSSSGGGSSSHHGWGGGGGWGGDGGGGGGGGFSGGDGGGGGF